MNWNPIEILRDRFDRFRAHPIQGALGIGAGFLGGPGAGQLVSRGFNWYNNHEFNNAVNNANNQLGDDIGSTNRDIWGQPLNGSLGQFDGSGQGTGGGSDNRQLAEALGGGGYNGPTQQPFQDNYGNNYGQGMPSSTPWTQPGNPGGLLDFLGPAPVDGPRNHEQIQQDMQTSQGMGPPALYGVSNFMVGGAPVINGIRPAGGDMNQAAMAHHWMGGA